MERLDEAAAEAGLEGLDWERDGDAIVTVRTFGDFAEALAWVNEVGALAEARDHHPDIAISWNRVTLTLTTHSDGGLTAKDLDLAAAIDALGPGPAGTPPA
jgi:4a-hydroxytetrahydrobiopterin dehydratase